MPAVAVKEPYVFVLHEDDFSESPREAFDHFGKMVCFHSRYNLGDKHEYKEPEDFLRDLARDTVSAKDICDFTIAEKAAGVELKYHQLDGDWLVIAKYDGDWEEVASFDNPITGREEEIADVILEYMDMASLVRLAEFENVILPLYLYDHSGLAMSTGSFVGRTQHAEWDSGQVGWIYAAKKDAAAEFGESGISTFGRTAEALEAEVSEYDSYLRGDCYGFQLYENGAQVDSCWGFLGRPEALKPDIEEYLPDACKGVMDNLVYLDTDREVDDFLREQERKPEMMKGVRTMSDNKLAHGSVEARAYPFAEPKGNILAGASISIGTDFGNFAITDISVINGKNGPFVSMPNRKDREGNFRDVAFPTTKEFREKLNEIVMDAYNSAIEKGLTERAAQKEAQEPERPSAAAKLESKKKEAAKTPKPPKAEKPAPAKDDAR